MAQPVPPAPPELPDLHAYEPPPESRDRVHPELVLAEVHVEQIAAALVAHRIRIVESDLRGVTLGAGDPAELVLRDARLADCDLSNVHPRNSELRRVELTNSRLVGVAFAEADLEDVRVTGGTLMLASFAQSTLRRVAFEDVNLRETSFAGARMLSVAFDGCDLRGADFRGVSLVDCTIRGTSLDGVAGVASLGGLTMPWTDLVGSVEALAAALGIEVEPREA
jgi:uncharacterized protein YjbI with pentapeptide repeats